MHDRNYQVNGQWQVSDKSGQVPPQDIGNGGNVLTQNDKISVNATYGKSRGTGTGGQGVGLPRGNWAPFQVTSAGLGNRYLRHQNSQGFTEVTDDNSSAALKQDATFRIVAAVDGTPCHSFESRNFPGSYLRHASGRLRTNRNDSTDLFRKDATFCAQTGLADGNGVSLASRNYPNSYIRHRSSEVWLGANNNSALFKRDASWNLAALSWSCRTLLPGVFVQCSSEHLAQ